MRAWDMPADLFWSLIPQLSQEAHNIYHEFLSSQALSPVNIDRQAWLSEEVLAQPRPDMFRAQQLQVRGQRARPGLRRETRETPSRTRCWGAVRAGGERAKLDAEPEPNAGPG